MYLYDRGGNLTGYLSAPYTLAPTIDGATEMVFYTYGDSNWKDKVTSIGGKAITYDAIGNPLTYDGWTFTWKAGRMLASMVKTGTNAQFTYDHNGMRIRKVINGVTTNYTLNGKNIVHMTQGSNDLHFFYDAQGKPAMVRFNGTDYFYVYNLRGDVVAMIDANGTQVVEYHYDAWGTPVAKTGSMAATLGTVNPFRYRGYVYDEETGLYYLRNRYYNPEWKRFINADVHVSTGKSILQCNVYAYCYNNSIKYADPDGNVAIVDDVVLMGAVLVAGLGFVALLNIPAIKGMVVKSSQAMLDAVKAVASFKLKLLQARKEPSRSLDQKGDPNTDADLLDESGELKQRRHYGSDGTAEYDIDYKHQDDGTHVFPHVHTWTNGKRSKKSIPYSEYFTPY